VTGNVTMGREFRGNVGYTDPYAFRGRTAGDISDNFAKNSAGVPQGNAPAPIPNKSTSFYGASQTVQPPPGFQMNATREGYVPPPPSAAFRPVADQRLGIVDLNQPLGGALPAPGEMITPGTLGGPGPAGAAKELGVLTASPLYGFRQWNPNDASDRYALEGILNRQYGPQTRSQIDPRELKRLQDELSKAMGEQLPGANDITQTEGSITPKPIGSTFETPTSPAIANAPLNNGQLVSRPLDADLGTEQGMYKRMIGSARKTSTQYSEMSKRLEQFYADRPKTDTDRAREFNADRTKAAAAAKAAKEALDKKNGVNPPTVPTAPVKPDPAADPAKPKVKKPAPVKITTLSQGIRGEGLSAIMKKAETLMKEGKFTSALDQYDQADAVTPNNPMVWLGRANAELGAGFFARADEHIRLALTTDKALLMGQFDLTGMLGEDRLTKLVAELKDIANKENKASPLFLLAYIAYNTGHERQALGYLDLAEKRGGDQAGFFKSLREHWALPEAEGTTPKPDATPAKPDATPAKPDATPAKPDLNK